MAGFKPADRRRSIFHDSLDSHSFAVHVGKRGEGGLEPVSFDPMRSKNHVHALVRAAVLSVSRLGIGEVAGYDLGALAFREKCRTADV
jgi:hypothetical protein